MSTSPLDNLEQFTTGKITDKNVPLLNIGSRTLDTPRKDILWKTYADDIIEPVSLTVEIKWTYRDGEKKVDVRDYLNYQLFPSALPWSDRHA